MDNNSAVRYLQTCKHRYALYHCFPLTELVSLHHLEAISEIRERFDPYYYRSDKNGEKLTRFECCWLAACSLVLVVGFIATLPLLVYWYLKDKLLSSCYPRRVDCCAESRRLRHHIGRVRPIPRITRVTGRCYGPSLPYLQHAEEMFVYDHLQEHITKYKLPRSLRRLYIALHRDRELSVDWLPPGLTMLAMAGGNEHVLQPGVLPQSLVTLVLHRGGKEWTANLPHTFFPQIAAGVLPSQLQRLDIEWSRPLTDLALPSSLTRLDLYELPNQPIPADYLPAGLRTLRISTAAFDSQQLFGALPSSLRMLQLYCTLTVPLTAAMLARIPLLEELDLGSRYPHRLNAVSLAPLTSLRVLRVGMVHWQPIAINELPASLCRLIVVPSASPRPPLDELVSMKASRGALDIIYDYEPYAITHCLDALNVFSELCPGNTLSLTSLTTARSLPSRSTFPTPSTLASAHVCYLCCSTRRSSVHCTGSSTGRTHNPRHSFRSARAR